jgi:hypothetical protein
MAIFEDLSIRLFPRRWSRKERDIYFSAARELGAEPIAFSTTDGYLAFAVRVEGRTYAYTYMMDGVFLDDLPIPYDEKAPPIDSFLEAIQASLKTIVEKSTK